MTVRARPDRGRRLGARLAPAPASAYVDQVAEVLPGISPEAALADGLQLCQKILAQGRGADSPADLVRSHFADRTNLDDDQVAAILQGALFGARRTTGLFRRSTWA